MTAERPEGRGVAANGVRGARAALAYLRSSGPDAAADLVVVFEDGEHLVHPLSRQSLSNLVADGADLLRFHLVRSPS